MTDAHEAIGKDMKKEPTDEFHGIKRHDLAGVPILSILVVEHDLTVMHRNDAMVGDGHSVGVPAEVIEHLFRSGKGLLGVDHPFLLLKFPDQLLEPRWHAEVNGAAGEAQFAGTIGSLQIIDELASEDAGECPDRKEEMPARSYPAFSVEGECTGRDHAMQMVVIHEYLAPGMEYKDEAHLAAQRVPWIMAELGQGLGYRLEENGVDLLLVALGDGVDIMRQGEHSVEILYRNELLNPRFEPLRLGHSLALGTVPVAARVVERSFITAPVATLDMSPLELGTTADDGGYDSSVGKGCRVGRLVVTAMDTEDICHLATLYRMLLGTGLRDWG